MDIYNDDGTVDRGKVNGLIRELNGKPSQLINLVDEVADAMYEQGYSDMQDMA